MCCLREVRLRIDLGVAGLDESSVQGVAALALTALSARWGWETRSPALDGSDLGGLIGRYGEFRIMRDAAGGVYLTGGRQFLDEVAAAFKTLYQAYALRGVLLAQGFSIGMDRGAGANEATVRVTASRGRDNLVVVFMGDGKALFDVRGCAGGGSVNDALLKALELAGVRSQEVSVLQHEGHDGGGVVDLAAARELAHAHR